MHETAPPKKRSSFAQSQFGGQIVSTGRYLIFILGIFGLFQFWFINRPIPERIETKFSMTLPDNVRDTGWYEWSWDGYVTLAKFTVDENDLETTLQSVRWQTNACISEAREPDYMPEFYTDASLDWWHPFDASRYEGVSCYDYNPKGLAPNYNVMVDYSIPGQATVYIEEYSVDANGNRALWKQGG